MRERFLRTLARLGLAVICHGAGATAAAAQPAAAPALTVSVAGGLNSAALTLPLGEVPEGFSATTGRRTGPTGGILIGTRSNGGVTFETGALFTVRGATATLTAPEEGSASTDLRMMYLDVPGHLRVGVAKFDRCRVSVIAGPTASFRLNARQRIKAPGVNVSEDFTSETTFFDLGLTAGGRVEAGRAFVDVRYTHGLRNMAPEAGPNGEAIKHRVVSVLAGWRLGK